MFKAVLSGATTLVIILAISGCIGDKPLVNSNPEVRREFKSALNVVTSANRDARLRPVVVLIPGGPGSSSNTLRSLQPLQTDFDLVFVDPPGTGRAKITNEVEYEPILRDIENAIESLNRRVVLVGHSFGGIQAADMAVRGNIKDIEGLICIASPLSVSSIQATAMNMKTHGSEEMHKKAAAFESNPSKESLFAWNREFKTLYFTEARVEAGNKMLFEDRDSYHLYLGASIGGAERIQGDLIADLKSVDVKKVLLAGELDKLVSKEDLRKDAEDADFEFKLIRGAAHYVGFDQPEVTVETLRKFLLN